MTPRSEVTGTQRYRPVQRTDEDALSETIIQLASEYGRYGYRRITALLQEAGWPVGKVASACIRLRPERVNHV